MKKTLLALILLTNIAIGYSQFEETPKYYKKIVFTYHQKSTIHIDNRGIYADTLLLNHYFPDLNFQKTTLPQNDIRTGGFIQMNQLSEADKNKLVAIISKRTYKIEGKYNLKKNKTTLRCSRIEINDTKALIKKHLNKSYRDFYFKDIIDYKKNRRSVNYQYTGITENFDIEKNKIEWTTTDPSIGKYNTTKNNLTYTNIVLINPKLEKHISPIVLFGNCESGIEKITTFDYTAELISISYQ
ncbi:hypothetical protein [Flavobacterium sp. K5-23]|uniref:hypothetical protein n=1 Tax=Flavobacterium sp. K5-23 TaxID=2746225 RepID=UPI00201011EC|nr:hypothetical protein [Flavobacterium sp. K5-23]UQD54881.1 hypothetical protein FLAK523_00170 [Flavobacterium sp. K5-23]